VDIVAPADGDVITLDYNYFNISVHYYVDTEEHAGSIRLYIYNDFSEKTRLDEQSIGAYSPARVYPHESTSERRVWVGDKQSGSYRIRAEFWNWKLKPGSGSEYMDNELVAVDEITVTLPPKDSDITDAPWVPETTAPPVFTTDPFVPAETTIPPGIDVGAIYISSSPGNAEIWINGRYTVETNYSIDNPFGFTDLTPGTYTVTLRKAGYLDYTEVVNLNPNEIYDIKAVMQPGTTATGWIVIYSDPAGVDVYLNNKKITTAPTTITDVQPGTYDLQLKKDGYEDWFYTISVTAGQITRIDATLSPVSGGFPVGAVAGGAVVLVGGGIAVKMLRGRGKGAAVPPAPKNLYQEWWDKASPDQRKDWSSFEQYLNSRLGPPRLNNFQDEYGRPSWSSAYTSWQQEVSQGKTKASWEEWVNNHSANQGIVNQMKAQAERNKDFRPKDIVEASAKYSEALRNKERFDRLTQLKQAVAGDSKLSDFAHEASNAIVKDGIVDANKLNRLEGTLKKWIIRDKMLPQTPDYTYSDAFYDTVDQGSKNIVVRVGAAYLTAGYSEMALNPISAVSTMRTSIMQGDSTLVAVTKGYAQSGTELALGESGRLVKYAKPYINNVKESYNLTKLSKVNSELSSEISTVNQLAKQTEGQMTRNAFMKSTDVAKAGKTPAYKLNSAEQEALRLNNNAEFRKLMAENSDLIPSNVKEVMGTAKQKVYQQARNDAVNDVMNQMGKDGVSTENPFFIRQTGTHAQPNNPGWNSVKSDFDHTVEFGNAKYNQLYEQKFNANLEGQGTSAKAIDANVYGEGTSSRGAYTGGAKKFVEHYNETSGSDIMIRNDKGVTTITRETPQSSTSLLSKMKPEDVKSAGENYQNFFKKDIAKGGDLNNQIVNGSKTVSRNAGQYSTNYVENFQKTGSVKYEPPPAAKVADLIKKQGYSVDDAMKKVGYNGNKEQLLNDFKKIMGL